MFGLGNVEGLDLPGEKPGLIPDTQWKKATFGDIWHPGETLVAGIGQGFITTTPLQLCVMAARIANGGYAVKPRLVRRITDESPNDEGTPVFPSLELSPDHLKVAAHRHGHGEQHRARHRLPLAHRHSRAWSWRARPAPARCGASPWRSARAACIKNEELPWNQRDHALVRRLRAGPCAALCLLRWWWSMAAAVRRSRRRSRATS